MSTSFPNPPITLKEERSSEWDITKPLHQRSCTNRPAARIAATSHPGEMRSCKHVILMVVVLLSMTEAEDINPVQKHTHTTSSGNVYVIDPWIRPPRGEESLEAVDKAGNFDGYPTIHAAESDRIMFVSRPIERFDAGMDGNNIQRHGVYVVTDLTVYDDDLPCPPLEWTDQQPCQVNALGLNATSCPGYETLFPLVEVRGNSGYITYTSPMLHELAADYGRMADGRKEVVLACPWIQSRAQEGGPTQSHCTNGMFVRVLIDNNPHNSEGRLSLRMSNVLFAIAAFLLSAFF